MVTIRVWLPANEDIKRLRRITAPLRIYKSDNHLESSKASPFLREVLDRHAALFLRSESGGDDLRLSVEYKDVVFKFEIFNLVVAAAVAPSSDMREVATFEDWDQIDCVLAFEWLRPASDAEVPSSWEKIVHRQGLRGEISDTATAIGVSMAGIVFRNSIRNLPVSMIYTDSSDPCSLLVSCDVHEIREFTVNCETVATEDFPRWKRDLKKWCASLGANQRPFASSL
jgi:hypothetical protein